MRTTGSIHLEREGLDFFFLACFPRELAYKRVVAAVARFARTVRVGLFFFSGRVCEEVEGRP